MTVENILQPDLFTGWHPSFEEAPYVVKLTSCKYLQYNYAKRMTL